MYRGDKAKTDQADLKKSPPGLFWKGRRLVPYLPLRAKELREELN
jgi:hypothetical protein